MSRLHSINKIAKTISLIFIPPTFLVFVFILIALKFETDLFSQIIVIGTALVFGAVIPIYFVVTSVKSKKIVNYEAENKDERTKPYLFGILLILIALALLQLFETSHISRLFWFIYGVNLAIVLIINKFWKISAHALGCSSAIGIVYLFFNFATVPLLIILVLVSWSRVQLKLHTVSQVIAGSVLGFVSTYFQLIYLTKFFK